MATGDSSFSIVFGSSVITAGNCNGDPATTGGSSTPSLFEICEVPSVFSRIDGVLDCSLGSTTGETSSDGTSFREDLVGVAYPLDLAGGGLESVDFGEGATSFESLSVEIIEGAADGAGEAEDRERLSEVDKEREEDESFLKIVDNLFLAL
jgi:hypothetical protein